MPTLKDIRPALRQFLLDDPAVLAAVGGTSAQARIYPVRLVQGQKNPSVVYNRISGGGDHHMQGASGLRQTRMQIDCWAVRQDQAVSLADLVKQRIDGIGPQTVLYGSSSPTDDMIIQGVFMAMEREDYDDAAELYRVSRDYIIWYEEQ